MWLSLVERSGLGQIACCSLRHAILLEHAGVEEKAAGEGRDKERGHRYTSKHQQHSAEPKGPDE